MRRPTSEGAGSGIIAAMPMNPLASRALPFAFVVLWSTGFGALTFLSLRYFAVIVLMGALALAARAPWPAGRREWMHIGVSGLLVHGVYLGGVFLAIGRGLPAGITSIVVGLQPLLTALAAGALFGERIVPRQWTGLALGFAGVALVVLSRGGGKPGVNFELTALLPALAALAGITAGMLYQKRFCPRFDWRTGAVAQFLPTLLATAAAAALTESMQVEWSTEFWIALGWLVLVLSLGAVSLLNLLIARGSAVNTASLFYLVPPCTALFAKLLFGETLPALALGGMGLAAWGVFLARR
jgi:drug/metabolite transporter (DMT)-like permease